MTSTPLFDRSQFNKTLDLIALRVPLKQISFSRKKLSGNLFTRPKFKSVCPDKKESSSLIDADCKCLLLSEKITSRELLGLSEELRTWVLEQEKFDLVSYPVDITYADCSIEEVLSTLLPKDVEIPASFECAGHVAHLNLRDQQLPYKHLIGQVFLDKNQPTVQTVVNKTSSIATEFRTFPMEVIAGKDDLNVQVRESKALFRFNYAEVYWNSRLQQEHLRMVRSFEKDQIICDMMCGIGPFAIPLAMKECKVYANDLNPKSFEYLKQNIALNKLTPKQIEAFNMDAREFVRHLVRSKKQFTQVLMNLPASALEFLDVFQDLFDEWEGSLPFIHCYCFSSEPENPQADVIRRAEGYLGAKLDDTTQAVARHVRDVAPNKNMLCLSFQLPAEAAYSSTYYENLRSGKRLKSTHKAE